MSKRSSLRFFFFFLSVVAPLLPTLLLQNELQTGVSAFQFPNVSEAASAGGGRNSLSGRGRPLTTSGPMSSSAQAPTGPNAKNPGGAAKKRVKKKRGAGAGLTELAATSTGALPNGGPSSSASTDAYDEQADSLWRTVNYHQLRDYRTVTVTVRRMFGEKGFREVDNTNDARIILCRHRDFSFPLSDFQRYNHVPGEHLMNKKNLLNDVLRDYERKNRVPPLLPPAWNLDKPDQLAELASLVGAKRIGEPSRPPAGSQGSGVKSKEEEEGGDNGDGGSQADSEREQEQQSRGRARGDDKTEARALSYSPWGHPLGDSPDGSAPVGSSVKWIYKPTDNTAHNGRGIFLHTEESVKRGIEEGTLCGRAALMQRYIPNPLLVKGRKFDLRLYMLIANVSPALVLYHDGIVRVSPEEFDPSKLSLDSHITNVERVKHNPDVKLTDFVWTLPQLQQELTEAGLAPPDWVESTLKPQVRKMVRESFQATRAQMSVRPRYFALQGVDVMVDSDLRPWLLEIQKSPSMDPGGPTGRHDHLPFKRPLIRQLWHGTIDTLDAVYAAQVEILRELRTQGMRAVNGQRLTPNAAMGAALHELKRLGWRTEAFKENGWEVVIDEFANEDVGGMTEAEFGPLAIAESPPEASEGAWAAASTEVQGGGGPVSLRSVSERKGPGGQKGEGDQGKDERGDGEGGNNGKGRDDLSETAAPPSVGFDLDASAASTFT
uniref:Tubulin--tyrosine ligase-like protein 9 n=1 Tax=Chromera velia CCMP2878 TaxID=1169474 RepID=A0A0G4HPE6_9ALVE|eukprot:Cvel_29776.t1-p1 / transcript=Cvel_29776.t1 / gene=Cvel_29776 / organism=Chromera_velia_CCMP2878 / gene_product=Inactive polyglycylase TTLL10, putative / transcript_product=Inactive polyglycylase TTLL10, putative / location=Cvel_scaffold4138:4730-10363(+) / protein_length=717 / sequence_SO=supercontig / SO=protein_coding / is_pseudo=false